MLIRLKKKTKNLKRVLLFLLCTSSGFRICQTFFYFRIIMFQRVFFSLAIWWKRSSIGQRATRPYVRTAGQMLETRDGCRGINLTQARAIERAVQRTAARRRSSHKRTESAYSASNELDVVGGIKSDSTAHAPFTPPLLVFIFELFKGVACLEGEFVFLLTWKSGT